MATTPKRTVSDIIESRDQSKLYMHLNYYKEWRDVFQAIKCRTSPIMRRNAAGDEVEDKTRTNVAMPDLNIIFRRNTARLTASSPKLRYLGGDPMIAEMLSALAIQQYDRSGEAIADRRVVMNAEGLGVGYSKLFWDTIAPTRVFRKAFMRGNNIVFRDRASVMRAQGAPEDEIQQAIQPPEQGGMGSDLSDDEVAQAMSKSGSEVMVPQEIKKYEGPCVKDVFPGDIFIENGVRCLNDSAFVIEQYTETDLWMQQMVKRGWLDPKACAELLDMNPGAEEPDSKINDLKQMFRGAISQSTPRPLEKRLLPQKRFDIIEYHALDEEGRMTVTWVSDKYREKPLGKMAYPWDLYGKTVYTEFVPLPDMIGAIGDSTPRLLRYLYLLKNLVVAQNFDYITQTLRPIVLRETGISIEDDVTERGLFRELAVSKLSGLLIPPMPPLPAGAFERTSYLRSEMGVAEPSINGVESGTQTSPMAGKTATTAMLASKAADALMQFKIDGRNLYLKEVGEKKLWMNQQAAQEPWEIGQNHWGEALNKAQDSGELAQWADQNGGQEQWAISSRYGKAAAIRLDPTEIQEDYQVEPEAGSFLAVDDELNKQAAMEVQAVATANPGIIDQRKLARFQLSKIRGIGNPDDLILPEQPPDPFAMFKGNAGLAIKFELLPDDVKNAFYAKFGVQRDPNDVAAEQTLENVKKMSEAADAADNMAAPSSDVVHDQNMQQKQQAQADKAKQFPPKKGKP